MLTYANPARFLDLSARLLPWCAGLTLVLLAAGLYLGLFVAPPDYQQGDTVRIMFVHVPSALLAQGVYVLMAAASVVALIWRHVLADLVAKAAAPLGAAFTLLALVTGSIWGKPMWGTWWVWDARLTSVLIQFFLYLGYMAVWQTLDDFAKAARVAAIVAIVGVINVPIIRFSVEWWNTLHQPASVVRMDGPAIHSSILIPLLVMMAAFALFFVTLLLVRTRSEIIGYRVRALQMRRAAS